MRSLSKHPQTLFRKHTKWPDHPQKNCKREEKNLDYTEPTDMAQKPISKKGINEVYKQNGDNYDPGMFVHIQVNNYVNGEDFECHIITKKETPRGCFQDMDGDHISTWHAKEDVVYLTTPII